MIIAKLFSTMFSMYTHTPNWALFFHVLNVYLDFSFCLSITLLTVLSCIAGISSRVDFLILNCDPLTFLLWDVIGSQHFCLSEYLSLTHILHIVCNLSFFFLPPSAIYSFFVTFLAFIASVEKSALDWSIHGQVTYKSSLLSLKTFMIIWNFLQ